MTQWTVRQSILFLVGSTCLTLTLSVAGYLLWKKGDRTKSLDPKYQIISIIQTGPEKEALKTVYLAELLSLSSDSFASLYDFDCKEGEKKLLLSPLISSASIKKMEPDALYIDYEVRKPIAWLSDYQNVGIDAQGHLFPMTPFFSPKELPEIYLGLPSFGADEDRFGRKGGKWQMPLQDRYFLLAQQILTALEGAPWKEGVILKKLDVSNALAPSLGQREIVLFTEENFRLKKEKEICCTFPKILRLSPKDYPQQLNHFFTLKRNMIEDYKKQLAKVSESTRFQSRIIDLRIPQLAFVENHF